MLKNIFLSISYDFFSSSHELFLFLKYATGPKLSSIKCFFIL